MSNQALLNINQIAARKGAAELEFAVKKVNSLDKSKGGPEGYLKAIERRVEDLVFDEVQKFQKEDNLLSTQSGNIVNNSNITWVLKPIDGTENFLKGYPHFSISLCSVVDNLITSAVIIDPIRREEFSAYSGSGASLNNNKIRASKQNTLKDATLSFKKSVKDKSFDFEKSHKELANQELNMRESGCLSLDLAYVGNINKTLDEEIEELLNNDATELDTIKKIDGIRAYVTKYTSLKEKDILNDCRNGFSKGNCRIQIDKVLEDIERIVFDGEIIGYSKKIRQLQARISKLEEEKVLLNEKKYSVTGEEEQNLENEMADIDAKIAKSYEYIKLLEEDLQIKMKNLGIRLSIDQIRVMTTRVDGDDLAKSIAIFDVTKQISNTLGQLVKDNSFSSNTTTKYYGVYLILSEILGFAQREYITKIDEEYLTKLESYKKSGYQSIEYANEQMRQATMESSKNIFKKNIEAEEFTIKVIDKYKGILLDQKAQLDDALITTDEQIAVAYSTYKTASNSSALMALMVDTQSTFDQILEMQMPEIIPFENIELENEFKSLSDKLNLD